MNLSAAQKAVRDFYTVFLQAAEQAQTKAVRYTKTNRVVNITRIVSFHVCSAMLGCVFAYWIALHIIQRWAVIGAIAGGAAGVILFVWQLYLNYRLMSEFATDKYKISVPKEMVEPENAESIIKSATLVYAETITVGNAENAPITQALYYQNGDKILCIDSAMCGVRLDRSTDSGFHYARKGDKLSDIAIPEDEWNRLTENIVILYPDEGAQVG